MNVVGIRMLREIFLSTNDTDHMIVFIFIMLIFILFVMMVGVVVPFMTLLVRVVGLGAYGLAGCD